MLYVLTILVALLGPAAAQQTPPPAQVPTTPAKAVQRTRAQSPPPFDEKADAEAAIANAVKLAATDDIRVLIAWGANDDNGSRQFIAARGAPAISQARFLSDEYRPVNVNVGRLDKNIDLAKRYGAKLQADALPALTVLDAAGKVVANTNAADLQADGDTAGIDPVKLASFLKSHQAPAPDAVAQFESALKQAKKEGKTVFVWFAAPW